MPTPSADPLHRTFFTIASHDTESTRQCAVTGKNGRSDYVSTETVPAFKDAVANLLESIEVKQNQLRFAAFKPVNGDTFDELPLDGEVLRDVVWNLEQIRDFNNLGPDQVQALNSNIEKIRLVIKKCPKPPKAQTQTKAPAGQQQPTAGSTSQATPTVATPADPASTRATLEKQLAQVKAEHGACAEKIKQNGLLIYAAIEKRKSTVALEQEKSKLIENYRSLTISLNDIEEKLKEMQQGAS